MSKIHQLGKDNYDTWSIHARAYLVKNKLWKNVNNPLIVTSKTSQEEIEADEIAKSELLLLISASELKQVKNAKTAKDVWDTLESIYASKGPARKASLLKQVILAKLDAQGDVREHLKAFMDNVDKLSDLGVEINNDLLSIIMLYSLSEDYENFRVAIETQDVLPSPERLKIKIIEESDARRRNLSVSDNEASSSREEAFYACCKICKRRGNIFNRKSHKICTSCWKKNASKNENVKNTNSSNRQDKNNFVQQCLHTNDRDNNASNNVWVLDSGCTSHMTYQKNLFKTIKSVTRKLSFATDEISAEIKGTGTVPIVTQCGSLTTTTNLMDTLYVPSLSTNLLSVSKMTNAGCSVVFSKNKAVVNSPKIGTTIVAEKESDGLYYVRPSKIKQSNNLTTETSQIKTADTSIENWHKKLGHMNVRDMKQALKNGSLIGLSFNANEALPECETCIKAKMHRVPAPSVTTTQRTSERLQIVHSDVCGPISTPTLGLNRYFVTFIDDCSKYCKVYLIKNKNEVLNKFKEFKVMAETFTGNKIKHLQTDNGTEYLNANFTDFLKENGIQRRLTAPYTPHQNGVAERKNRTLIEKARAMLLESKAPLCLWGEAIMTANYLSNRSVNQSIEGMTPFEKWVGRKPCVNHLYIFGVKTFILLKDTNRHKFTSKAIPGMFAGYSETSKAFRIYVPSKRNVVISKDVRVLKKMYFDEQSNGISTLFEKSTNDDNSDDDDDFKNGIITLENNTTQKRLSSQENVVNSTQLIESDYESAPEDDNIVTADILSGNDNPIHETAENESENENEEREPIQRQLRDRTRLAPPNRFDDFILTAVESEKPIEPQTFKEAIMSTDKVEWLDAMHSELTSLNENETWDLVDLPKGRKPLPCKWIYKVKMNPDGTIERYKARLVVKGFSQKPGTDYDKTFSPVVRLSTIRALLGLAAQENMVLQQFDVSTAFLNGSVREDIYMVQPEGFSDGTKRVCKLKRSLYGLKQAPLCWNTCISEYLIETGFKQSVHDPCLYIKKHVLIALYVDDGLVASTNEKAGRDFIEQLKSRFKITTKAASYFLGMEIHKSKDGEITLDQKAYTEKILIKYGMANCKSVPTPAVKATLEEQEEEDALDDSNFPYRQAVGSLSYLMVATRPDICYAVGVVSRHLDNPRKLDVKNVKRIFRYLKGTIDMRLIFKKSGKDNILLGYSDADYGGDSTTGHSTSGMIFFFSGPIMWKSKKQNSVAISSTEAELIALTETAKEVIWLKGMLEDITKLREVPVIYVDNVSTIKLSENPPFEFHRRTKHIKIKYFFVRECVTNKELRLESVPTELQLADSFTKPLYGPRLLQLCQKIGLKRIS